MLSIDLASELSGPKVEVDFDILVEVSQVRDLVTIGDQARKITT